MPEQMMRIAGRGYDGTAKALTTDNDGRQEMKLADIDKRIIRDSVTVEAGQTNIIDIDTKRPYKVIVQKTNNFDEPWRLRKDVYLGGTPIPATGTEFILGSDGSKVTIGNGNRVNAYSDLILPLENRTQFMLMNEGTSSGVFSVYLIEYPMGVSDPSINAVISGYSDSLNKKNRNIHDARSTTALSSEWVIFENNNETELDYLEFSTNINSAQFFIEYRNDSGEFKPIGHIMVDGSQVAGFTPKLIVEQGASLWKIMSYENGAYKFALNQSLTFAKGLRIRAVRSGDAVNFACRFFGVEYV